MNGKKRKLKKEGKYNEAAGLYTGEFRKGSWIDNEDGSERSWKEGPFRNRAVETWNGDKTIYKGHKGDKPGQRVWDKKKTIQKGSWGFGIDGKEVEVEGTMKKKYDKSGNVTKEKFRAKSAKDRKMFRKIDRNEKK